MTRIPFVVTYNGISAYCYLQTDAKCNVRQLEFGRLSDFDVKDVSAGADFMVALQEKIEFLNDLMHADVPFDALASCRRSPGLFGAIMDPAATAFENVKTALGAPANVA